MPPRDFFRDLPKPFIRHIEELRWRLLSCVIALFLGAVAGYFFVDVVIRALADVVGPLVFLRPAEAFVSRLKIASFLGVFLSVPVFLYHIWRFVGVALTVKERRVILGALPFSYLLFATGVCFSWFLIVPTGLRFLVGFASPYIQPFLSIDACFEFALWLSIGLGLLFQLPVAVAALAQWGFLRAETLRAYRRHAVVAILILSAILTPSPDVFSQMLMALPTYFLFEISIWVAHFLQPKEDISVAGTSNHRH